MAAPKLVYKDIDLNFQYNPLTGDIAIIKDREAVRQSIRNLILTLFYERPFQPSLGSKVKALLFEPVSPFTLIKLKSEIELTIKNHEPRAEVIGVNVDLDEDRNGFDVKIAFYMVNLVEPVNVGIFLERVR